MIVNRQACEAYEVCKPRTVRGEIYLHLIDDMFVDIQLYDRDVWRTDMPSLQAR